MLYHYQILHRYGPSIRTCHQMMNKQFTIPTICMIAIQTLNCLERIHKSMVVHRNLGLKKLLTVNNVSNELVINDFRYATKYKKTFSTVHPQSNDAFIDKSNLNQHSSINLHLGIVSCPRDDLESLSYILLFLAHRRTLFPIDKKNPNYPKLIEKLKMDFIPESLSSYVASEFIQFYSYIRMSNISDYPMQDYENFRKLFRNLMQKHGYPEKSYIYPWNTVPPKKQTTQLKHSTSIDMFEEIKANSKKKQSQFRQDMDAPSDEQQNLEFNIVQLNETSKKPRANLEEMSQKSTKVFQPHEI